MATTPNKVRSSTPIGTTPILTSTEPVSDNKQIQAKEDNKLADLIKTVDKLLQENEALKKSVDQNVFNANLSTSNKDKRLLVRLEMVNGKPVKGWSDLITNEVYVNPHTGQVQENQTLTLYFLDGTEMETTYSTAHNHQNRTDWLPVNSTRTDMDGNVFYMVEYLGKNYEINQKFIN